jgi:hypothetical protein
MQSADRFLPHEISELQSRLKTFSTLASHLRAANPRVIGQVEAVEAEVDLLRLKLFGRPRASVPCLFEERGFTGGEIEDANHFQSAIEQKGGVAC